MEQQTLIKLAEKGSGGDFDHIAMSKLFTLELVEVNSKRRLVLTKAGKALYRKIVRGGPERRGSAGEVPAQA